MAGSKIKQLDAVIKEIQSQQSQVVKIEEVRAQCIIEHPSGFGNSGIFTTSVVTCAQMHA